MFYLKTKKLQQESSFDQIFQTYGDLIYDLCCSLLPQTQTQIYAFRSTLKQIKKELGTRKFQRYERAWILKLTYDSILTLTKESKDPPFILNLESKNKPESQMIQAYFQHLPKEDQFLLILKDKYSIELTEISSVLELPESSLQLKREQALRTLEHWIVIKPSKLVRWISELPKQTLSDSLKKSPFTASLPRPSLSGHPVNPRWQRTPWYVRSGAEGIGIAAVILLFVWIIPNLHKNYQKHLEQRLEGFELADISKDLENDQTEGHREISSTLPHTPTAEHLRIEDFSKIKPGDSEIWRINIKTDSPKEVKAKVVETLLKFKISNGSTDLQGTIAPGGIQFNLLIAKNSIPDLMQEMKKISRPLSQTNQANSLSQNFTWFKNKSRAEIPTGQSRVIIWLSQI